MRVGARLAVVLAFLALFTQWLAPTAHSFAAPAAPETVFADLRSTFGDAAILCTQIQDDGSPSGPADSHRHGDECCPLCQLHLGAQLLIAPSAAVLPARFATRVDAVVPRPSFIAIANLGSSSAQPRAPPFEV